MKMFFVRPVRVCFKSGNIVYIETLFKREKGLLKIFYVVTGQKGLLVLTDYGTPVIGIFCIIFTMYSILGRAIANRSFAADITMTGIKG
jgi:hypothetical protein